MIDPKLVWLFAKDAADKVVDYDFAGNPITEADVLLMGAYGPLVIRIADEAMKYGAAQVRAKKGFAHDV